LTCSADTMIGCPARNLRRYATVYAGRFLLTTACFGSAICFRIYSSSHFGSGVSKTGAAVHYTAETGAGFSFASDATIAPYIRRTSTGRISWVPSLYFPAAIFPPQPLK
jgi:hypothetical protein